MGQPFGTIVGIEQDGIVGTIPVPDEFEHIAHMDNGAWIVHRMARESAHGAFVPLHHLGYELSHDHLALLPYRT